MKRNPDLLYAFALSLLFAIMDGATFALAAGPVGRLPLAAPPLGNVLHSLIVFTLGTLVGCLAFLIVGKKKRLVPWGYSFFALYLLICCALVGFQIPPENQASAWEMLLYCGLVPTVVGMGVSWGIYGLLKKKERPAS